MHVSTRRARDTPSPLAQPQWHVCLQCEPSICGTKAGGENREKWQYWRISSSASVTRPPSYAWQPPQSALVPRWRKPSSVHDDNAGVASLIGRCTFRHPMKLHLVGL
eukprot:scaffold27879_cov40-Phaeocystis_antarctica.AAC.3